MQLNAVAIISLLCLSVAALLVRETAACPSGCTCYQRTVRCLRARLNAVPSTIPQDTNMIDFRFNHIEQLPSQAFAGLGLVTTLFLANNEIALLQPGALDGMPALRILYLNNNRLTRLPAQLFARQRQLEAIFLENNDLWQLDPATFNNLPRLNRLMLFNNKLASIPIDAFVGLPSLKRLRLDGNPLACDCGVHALWRHYQRNQVEIMLNCDTPAELRGFDFRQLQDQHFHCMKPEILLAPHDMELVAGASAELPCAMQADPAPEIVWLQNTNEITAHSTGHLHVMPSGNLRIEPMQASDVGIYECIGRNTMGETRTPPVRLLLAGDGDPHEDARHNEIWSGPITQPPLGVIAANAPPVAPHFTTTPSNRIVGIGQNVEVLLDCAAVGVPQPEIQWFFNRRPVVWQSSPQLQLLGNGSLVLVQPTPQMEGVYRCEASNALGSIEASARIELKELPEILRGPQNQTIKSGKPFLLECDADGNPEPLISWQHNGQLVEPNEHVVLESENTELLVRAARESDTGVYTCIAENENGRVLVSATLTVVSGNGPPTILIEPFDLEAISGTTIELPCKSDESEGVQISWRKDGRIIDPNVLLTDRYEISGAGSLFVKNVTIADGGRYECSVRNGFGRSTASALITIKHIVDLGPGDRYVRIAFAEAASEIDVAINNTIEMLFNNGSATRNPGDLLRNFRFPTGEARQLARAAEIYERTLVNIRKHLLRGDNLTMRSEQYEFRDLLSREHLHLVAELSGCQEHRERPNCTDMCYHSRYRTIDGTCNNLRQPTWGASLTAFRRIAPPVYEDGFSMPVGWTKNMLYGGHPKPSARLVSTSLVTTKDVTPDTRITHMVMQWGQFVDHDLDHALPSVSSESWDGIDCKKTCEFAPPCYPIEVPPNDPRVHNRRCIDLVRSSAVCGSGMTSVFFDSVQHREQINQLTSYHDASQVYGYSYEFAQELRNLTSDDGLLRVGVHFPRQGDLLPFAAPQDGMDCRRNLDENQMNCFVAGDIRVNEQISLLAMHTIWMREHNRIARQLRDINPHWNGDTIYQEARKVVGAEMQHITYKHWLPLVIGASGMQQLGTYDRYDPTVEPTIANEFATAAFRFGHSLINPVLERLDRDFKPIAQGHLPLHKAFFAPWRIAYEGGVDPLMRGMYAVAAKLKTPTQSLNSELTEKLFQTAHAVALDLAAINIQRGRDHGLPSYNEYRRFCKMRVAESFEDLSGEISSGEVRQKLKELYGHPDNIDVWLGGILEDVVEGGKVGALFQCMLVDQFRRLRDGDRFYYEKPGVFMPEQLEQIKQANLGRVLCDNGDRIDRITQNVFLLPEAQGGFSDCEDVPGINLYLWQDCGACNSMPPLFDTYIPQTYVKQNNERSKRAIVDDDDDATVLADNVLDMEGAVQEERIGGLEEVVGSFLRELKKVHKKLRKLEQSCAANDEDDADATKSATSPKRSHCTDAGGTTRINNEIWSPDACTKCDCRRGQVTCTHEHCAEVHCDDGVEPLIPPEECCAHCPAQLGVAAEGKP